MEPSALLVGIGILYGVNVDMLEHSFRRLPEWGPVLTMGFHVGACSFVAAGLSARFSFSQVALEAESFWMVEQGPLSSTEMLQAKVRSSALLVVGFPILLCAFASLFMPFSVFQRIASVTIVTFTAWQLVKQAVGMGAIGPRFDAATVMEATMGAAALSTMAWGISMAFWSTTWAVTSLLLSKTFGLGNSVFALCALPWAAGLWWRGKRSQRKGVDALEHRRLFPQAV
ncbi:MAG: hypothetical protein GY822_16480 [Deltaproteobacteria bacterium]|nr:hypothetical protein [Deltaproteobacteria bacterium]